MKPKLAELFLSVGSQLNLQILVWGGSEKHASLPWYGTRYAHKNVWSNFIKLLER
jgi:hypothetical protein